MGEMTIKGYAEKTVDCDVAEYTLKFMGEGATIPEAAKKSSDELERFLEIMEENGIGSDFFELGDNSTSKKYRSENEEMPYQSQRTITAKMPLNTANADAIMQCISKYQINVEFTDSYLYSKKTELQKELLKEAVDDSRARAEMIASCAGQKIQGIKRIGTDLKNIKKSVAIDDSCVFNLFGTNACGASRAQKLSAPTVTEKEEVSVIWLIDD